MSQIPKDKLPPTYYWMSCGCKLHEHGLKRRYTQKVCREHGGYIVRRTRQCFDCSIELKLCKKGNGKLRCPSCEAIEQEKLRIKNNKIANIKRQEKIKLLPAKEKKRDRRLKPLTPEMIKKQADAVDLKIQAARLKINKTRGEYCMEFKTCLAEKRLVCHRCDDFKKFPVIGIDPGVEAFYKSF